VFLRQGGKYLWRSLELIGCIPIRVEDFNTVNALCTNCNKKLLPVLNLHKARMGNRCDPASRVHGTSNIAKPQPLKWDITWLSSRDEPVKRLFK